MVILGGLDAESDDGVYEHYHGLLLGIFPGCSRCRANLKGHSGAD